MQRDTAIGGHDLRALARLGTWTSALPAVRALTGAATALLALAFLYAAVTTEGYFTVVNGKAILSSVALVGIVAVGMTAIVLSGNLFSLSLGISAAISAMFFLYTLRFGLGLAIPLTLLFGLLANALQGIVIGGWQANPIIVTIAAGSIQEGIAVWITAGRSVFPPEASTSYEFLARPLGGLPFGIYVLVGVALVAELILRRTRFGREIYLLGDSRRAARAAAVGLTRVTAGVFALAGCCAAVAGILLGAQSRHGELLLGGTLTYDAFAAALVGGNAITGGRGSVIRTLFGALVIASVSDLLLLRGYSSGVQIMVKGLIVVCVVVLVHLNTPRRAG
jgi:ribose/xylose/arabinose/galactoside ABC-type transport system permease subunit